MGRRSSPHSRAKPLGEYLQVVSIVIVDGYWLRLELTASTSASIQFLKCTIPCLDPIPSWLYIAHHGIRTPV